ncbi:MAG TPA: DUF3352 domain-containing protein [candidate division Zixibacteria bacterium]|nr:DUF3352 domain-containing protein [candidate division Zixibacteria bacterium]
MHRLVIATTALLTMIGATVVAGYLFVFAAGADRLARAVPGGAAFYATAYLQPSTGQKMNLAELLGHVPGFADAASLDQKIHEITARLLGEAGVDYERDVRPWLGNQVALAVRPDSADPIEADVWVLLATRDAAAAEEALQRIAADQGAAVTDDEHHGVTIHRAADSAWAVLEDLVVLSPTVEGVTQVLDVEAGRADALAGEAEFRQAMGRLPADHLGAVYASSSALVGAAGTEVPATGYDTLSLALVAESDGLHLSGIAPFDADAVPQPLREAFELGRQAGELSGWMPDDTQAAVLFFGLSQSVAAAEEQLGELEGGQEVGDALDQFRALAAFGLGIDVDDDLLPLFDGETAVAVDGLDRAEPAPLLLLRPSDGDGAEARLERLRDALEERGASVSEQEAAGVTVTSIEVPDLATVSYAVRDGVVLAGLSVEDVADALEAHDGDSLADTPRYAAAWELAGTRGGPEIYVDVAALIDGFGSEVGIEGEAGDILREIGALAVTAPARESHSEIHIVLTVR